MQQLIDVEFTDADRVFLRKQGRYYLISSKASAVRPLADRAKEMQQYLQAHKLKFNGSSARLPWCSWPLTTAACRPASGTFAPSFLSFPLFSGFFMTFAYRVLLVSTLALLCLPGYGQQAAEPPITGDV